MIPGLVAVWMAGTAARADEPEVWFEYAFTRVVDRGTGAYTGYGEHLESSGRYDVAAFATVDEPTVKAHYQWTFSPSDAPATTGQTSRTTTFSKADRHYRSAIDLDDDEWKTVDPKALAVWFWIPPDTAVGAQIDTLDHTCTVTARDATTPDGARKGIVCAATSGGRRDDAYGQMTTAWTETTYFDPATGWIVAQTREELDDGTTSGEAATFQMHESLIVKQASYAAPIVVMESPAPPGAADVTHRDDDAAVGIIATVAMIISQLCCSVVPMLAPIVLIGAIAWWVIRANKAPVKIDGTQYGTVNFRKATAAIEVARFTKTSATSTFAPFLEDFARKAFTTGDPVHLAIAGDDLVGFGLLDTETRLGSVFAPDVQVAAGLVKWLGCTEFFTETRHQDAAGKRPYNVYETFKVLRLDAIPATPYDAALVAPMAPGDKAEMIAVATEVHPGVPVEKWLSAQITTGDLCYVARIDGKIVGFGFASVVDPHGRLHTLAVLPKYRDKGVGKELVRARLNALRELGVTDVISEISESAPASLHIAIELGFREIGAMLVETTRGERVARPIVRR